MTKRRPERRFGSRPIAREIPHRDKRRDRRGRKFLSRARDFLEFNTRSFKERGGGQLERNDFLQSSQGGATLGTRFARSVSRAREKDRERENCAVDRGASCCILPPEHVISSRTVSPIPGHFIARLLLPLSLSHFCPVPLPVQPLQRV